MLVMTPDFKIRISIVLYILREVAGHDNISSFTFEQTTHTCAVALLERLKTDLTLHVF